MLSHHVRRAVRRNPLPKQWRMSSSGSGGPEGEDDLIRSMLSGNHEAEDSGHVLGVRQHTFTASGLKRAKIGAVVDVGGALGVVQGLHNQYVTITPIDAKPVARIGTAVKLVQPTTTDLPALFNRIIDPLGRPLQVQQTMTANVFQPEDGSLPSKQLTERWASFRGSINPAHDLSLLPRPESLIRTGNPAIDAFFPIARGAPTCVTGGPDTDKTSLVTSIALSNLAEADLVVFVSLGKSVEQVHALHSKLKQAGRTAVVVAAPRGSSAGTTLYAPFTGMALGQVAANMGKHVLCIMDDLRDHAGAYNEIAQELAQPSSGLRTLETMQSTAVPPLSVYASLLERCGVAASGGTLSALVACSRESSDNEKDIHMVGGEEDAVAEHIRAVCGGEIRLSSKIARKRLFPPVDVLSLAGYPRSPYLPLMDPKLRAKAQHVGHAIRQAKDLKDAISAAETFGIKLDEEVGEDFTGQLQVLNKLQDLITSASQRVEPADATAKVTYEGRVNDMLDEMLEVVRPLDISKRVV